MDLENLQNPIVPLCPALCVCTERGVLLSGLFPGGGRLEERTEKEGCGAGNAVTFVLYNFTKIK